MDTSLTEVPQYLKYWVGDEGRNYRNQFVGRQDGLTNPTPNELRESLTRHRPKTVLEIGCGYGRLLSQLQHEPYEVEGLDVSLQMLDTCPKGLQVYAWDIAEHPAPKLYDVVFTRGVLVYFHSDQDLLTKTVQNILDSCSVAAVLWEPPEMIEKIKSLSLRDSHRLDFCPIQPGPYLPCIL